MSGPSKTDKAAINDLLSKIQAGGGAPEKGFRDMTKEEKQAYGERMKKAQVGPKLAGLQIKALSQMVSGLKQKRFQCQQSMDQATENIHHLDAEIARIKVRYDPLCRQIKEREAKRAQLQKRLDNCHEQLAGVLLPCCD